MITTDNLAELLSTVPGAEPRHTHWQVHTRIPRGSQDSVWHGCQCGRHMQADLCGGSVLQKKFREGKDFCTSAWLVREGLAGETIFDLA